MGRIMILYAIVLQVISTGYSQNVNKRFEEKLSLYHKSQQHIVSPINLLNPDKYEFFTINDRGDIIKRLMTRKEIQSIVAGSETKEFTLNRLEVPQGIIGNIVSNIKNVLNTELLTKDMQSPQHDTVQMADVATNEDINDDFNKLDSKNISSYQNKSDEGTTDITPDTATKPIIEKGTGLFDMTDSTVSVTEPQSNTVSNIQMTNDDTLKNENTESTETTTERYLEIEPDAINTSTDINNILTTGHVEREDIADANSTVMSQTYDVTTDTTINVSTDDMMSESVQPTYVGNMFDVETTAEDQPMKYTETTTEEMELSSTYQPNFEYTSNLLSDTYNFEMTTKQNEAQNSIFQIIEFLKDRDQEAIIQNLVNDNQPQTTDAESTVATTDFTIFTTMSPETDLTESTHHSDFDESDTTDAAFPTNIVLDNDTPMAPETNDVSPSTENPPDSLIELLHNNSLSIAEVVLRISNLPNASTNAMAAEPDVSVISHLLNNPTKNMAMYVNETATVASILNYAPTTEASDTLHELPEDFSVQEDVFQSVLSISNELNRDVSIYENLGEIDGAHLTQSKNSLGGTEWIEGLDDMDDDENDELDQFFERCNTIGIRMYNAVSSKNVSEDKRNFVYSPFATLSILSMLHLGAKGKSAEDINKIIGLDDMSSFNPHLIFKSISDSVEHNTVESFFIRMLFSEDGKGKLLNFFKNKVKQFYSGFAEEISFTNSTYLVDRIDQLMSNYSSEIEFFKHNSNVLFVPPLCLMSFNSFLIGETARNLDEIFFHVIDHQGTRKLRMLPAVTFSDNFVAGYITEMDITAAKIMSTERDISITLLMPGKQGGTLKSDSLANLETLIFNDDFSSKIDFLVRNIKPKSVKHLQVPQFEYEAFLDMTETLKILGLKDLFQNNTSNFQGIQESTATPLYLSQILQYNKLSFGNAYVTEHTSTTQSEPENIEHSTNSFVMKYDKPFIFIVEHNPTSMLLYLGRFNPVE
ncbi:uncharacterized protein LOC129750075 [Uranotaenia lowii]|uniref:uncharacterized protein LOC129750075 n=1 Tax=Uranotaenia lowii TaxID=190385 RepID=UPI0024787945|nr:uncharacterized protein LOC129750075 [Uranotaenia lowii]